MEKVLEQLLFKTEDLLWMWGILQMDFVKSKKRLVLGGGLFAVFLAWDGYIGFGKITSLLEIAIAAVIVPIIFEGRMSETLLKFAFSLFALSIVGGPIATIFRVAGVNTEWWKQYGDILHEIILIAILVVIIIILHRFEGVRRKIKNLPWYYYAIGFVICFSAELLRTYVRLFGEGQGARIENFADILCTCLIEGVYFLAIALVVINELRKDYREESLLKSELMKSLRGYHQLQEEHMREVRKIRHDIKNHLLIVRRHLEKEEVEEAKEYLDQIEGISLWRKRNMTDVGNDVVSTILSMEQGKAGAGVVFCCEGCLSNENPIQDYDLCVIFSNLLANAREACEKLHREEKKITVLLREEGGETQIMIKNPIEWEMDVDKLGDYTSKKEKRGHGYGLQNVMDTVKRYEGEIKFRVKDGMFVVSIKI